MPSDKIDENILYILCYCYTVSDSIICNKLCVMFYAQIVTVYHMHTNFSGTIFLRIL